MSNQGFQQLGECLRLRCGAALTVIVSTVLCWPAAVRADVQPVTQMGGPPELPHATFEETGLPNFTMPVGKSTLPPTVSPGDGTGPGGGSVGGGGGTSADAVLQSRSWGTLAAQNVSAIGVNSSVVAATCVIESGCQNVAARAGGTINGAFQMSDSTYSGDIRQALAQNPSLAGSIDTSLGGKMNPANQAIAAAQELKNSALALQQAGIPDPTFLDTRGAYNFGAGYGIQLARSSGDRLMSDVLTSYSQQTLTANGISPSTTVGQWRQGILSKVGSAANQPILSRAG